MARSCGQVFPLIPFYMQDDIRHLFWMQNR